MKVIKIILGCILTTISALFLVSYILYKTQLENALSLAFNNYNEWLPIFMCVVCGLFAMFCFYTPNSKSFAKLRERISKEQSILVENIEDKASKLNEVVKDVEKQKDLVIFELERENEMYKAFIIKICELSPNKKIQELSKMMIEKTRPIVVKLKEEIKDKPQEVSDLIKEAVKMYMEENKPTQETEIKSVIKNKPVKKIKIKVKRNKK